jgi:hypothetical protein
MACATLPDTLFIGCDDGALYRVGDYSQPVRPNYSGHRRAIETVADLKATLRAGPYAWPGGYAIYFVTADGAVLSFAAALAEFRIIAGAIRDGDTRGGWRIVGTGCTADDDDTPVCDHTGLPIE